MTEQEAAQKGDLPEVLETPSSTVPAVFSRDPKQALVQMQELVKHVASKCVGPNFISNIRGKQYPKVEWWTTVGAPLGLFPVTEWSRKLDRDGEVAYEARVSVRSHGNIVTAAESLCSSKEENWQDDDGNPKDEHAIKSMSITRATSKAYRIGLSMLAVMAGLEPTPAEEVPRGGFPGSGTNGKPPQFSRDFKMPAGKFEGKTLKELPRRYVTWLQNNDRRPWLRDFARQELAIRKTDRQPKKISKKQRERIEELAEQLWGDIWEEEFDKILDRMFKVESFKDLTYNEANTMGRRLKQAVAEKSSNPERNGGTGPNGASHNDIEDLIKIAGYTWKMTSRENIIGILNDRAKKRWNKEITQLDQATIRQMKLDVMDGKLSPQE